MNSAKGLPLVDGRGYIYDVFDMGDGRVLKKEKPKWKQYWLHLQHNHSPAHVEKNNALSRHLTSVLPNLAVLGHPTWLSKRSYTQDKVVILEDYFKSHSFEENKRVIDALIQSIFETWSLGFGDLIFNVTHNNGLRADGSVILLDFNEVSVHKEDILARIAMRRWVKAHSYTRVLPDGELKVYYAAAMDAAMTEENLNRYWKDNEQLLAKTA